jgi:hypothetical protein
VHFELMFNMNRNIACDQEYNNNMSLYNASYGTMHLNCLQQKYSQEIMTMVHLSQYVFPEVCLIKNENTFVTVYCHLTQIM